MSDKNDQSQPPMAADLKAAIERIRQQTATAEMVAKTMSQAIELNRSVIPDGSADGPSKVHWLLATGIAASILLVASIGLVRHRLATNGDQPVQSHNDVIYSPVTRSSLVLVAYRAVDEDMARADAKVKNLSEALELATLRREIQATLDEYYDWSNGE